jgi:hypothetical protein
VSIETQNKMYMFRMEDGRINPEIAYRAEILAEPHNIRARQAAGTVGDPRPRFLAKGVGTRTLKMSVRHHPAAPRKDFVQGERGFD